jgi:hypothetical protein
MSEVLNRTDGLQSVPRGTDSETLLWSLTVSRYAAYAKLPPGFYAASSALPAHLPARLC